MNDTAPDDALKLLAARYGFARVRSTSKDVIVVDMPLDSGGVFIAVLTGRQAEYLVKHPIRAEDLRDRKRLPREWPR